MRKRRKRHIKYKVERVLLSDVLPFEVPITFTNRYFYDFLLSCKAKLEGNEISINANNTATSQTILKLLFGIKHDKSFKNGKINFTEQEKISIPFSYKIAHKENDFRDLCIIHPKNQFIIVDFYHTYQDLILYYCNKSQFSIRRPHRVARYTYFKDRLHLEKLADIDNKITERNDLEYENLKTFFAYKKYSNIYEFYESYQYHRCEKKFNSLFRFDISKCFDSIYTHSISWALLNKEVVKEYLNEDKKTFGGRFDALMQNLNYQETNGIVIGPEFSRIFSELILQKIDNIVEQELVALGLYCKKDYEVFRYVDDYFVFYNEESTKETILTNFRLALRDFKLSLNEAKMLQYGKPIITEITIAKQKIDTLFNDSLAYKIEEHEIADTNSEKLIKRRKGQVHITAGKLITKFKTIVFESRVAYKDILNYTFAILEKKLQVLIKDYFKIVHKKNTEKEFIRALLELLEFVFFLYLVSPRVNTTIRLCRILRLITETLKLGDKFNTDFKHLIFKKIYDNIIFTLHKNKATAHTQVETLYLLIALRELGNKYWLTEDILASYLQIKKSEETFHSDTELNYFIIVVSLFYMKDKVRYKALRSFIINKALERFETTNYTSRIKRTELILLLFDLLAYPYIDITSVKKKLLKLYNIKDTSLQSDIIGARNNWFTIWSEFDFGKELDAKQGQEVY